MRFLPAILAASVLLAPATSLALTQPNGATIPSPPGCDGGKPTGLAATFACVCDVPGVCNIGGTCPDATSCPDGKNAKCETTLWHSFNDNTCIPSNLSGLDPAKDAALTPETFRPSCALSFTLVTRGTAMFRDVFGWYNVTGAKPAASDLYPMLDCTATPGKVVTLDVKSDPRYKGGDIGFFIVTPEDGTSKACAGGDCCAAVGRYPGAGHLFFSERKYNDDNTGGSPFIHLLVFDSKVTPRKFYFAWEDIYGGSNNDFTDILTSVDGVECSGGGELCDTGKPGRCARGVRACKNGGLACVDMLGPTAEVCNGIDDDCDGMIDDDATCPNAGDICSQGRCVASCASGEFPCGTGLECHVGSGRCVPTGCGGITCPAGQICNKGVCGPSCAGIVCPHGQSCVGNACVDLCAGVKCGAGEVCRDGACIAGCSQCGGVQCAAGKSCDPATGACVDKSCAQPCPEGTYCEAGQCKDACAGAVCPEGLTCAKGSCVDPSSVGPSSKGLEPGSSGGTGADDWNRNASGCSCDAAVGAPSGSTALAAIVAFALGAARRRRRYCGSKTIR